jgi:hypothetical protein
MTDNRTPVIQLNRAPIEKEFRPITTSSILFWIAKYRNIVKLTSHFADSDINIPIIEILYNLENNIILDPLNFHEDDYKKMFIKNDNSETHKEVKEHLEWLVGSDRDRIVKEQYKTKIDRLAQEIDGKT